MQIKSIGFPRMHKEKNERRDFLPELFKKLGKLKDIKIFLEDGYGGDMNFTHEDYLKMNPKLQFVSHNEAYMQDMVIVLRAPEENEIKIMKKNAILVSMLHFETRPTRNKLLIDQGLDCYSMDSLTDDKNNRILVNYKGTSRSGVRIAYNELKKRMRDFYSADRRPIFATIIGFGPVALNAAKALEEFSDIDFLYIDEPVKGIIVRMISRSITKDIEILESIMTDTDLLIDASRRIDTSQFIIPNCLLSYLPKHAIILDLSTDPYNDKIKPIQVKGIEGIPTGTLDKLVIEPNDELYESIPKEVDTTNRRVVVSCNAWPGVDPVECMEIYGEQIYGFLNVMTQKDTNDLDINSEDLYERALVRASLKYYMKDENK